MLSTELASILAPFGQLANKHALSNIYKTLEVTPETIRGCAPWGILEATVNLEIPEPFYIDALNFIAVVRSLPKDELQLEIKASALHWECGNAEGKLAVIGKVDIPNTDWAILKKKMYNPDKNFIQALELGSLSCGPMSMSSAGVYGVTLDNTVNGLFVASSDNVTMANCFADISDYFSVWPDKLTLVPDALEMLITVLKQKGDRAPKLLLQDKAIYARAGAFRLMLRPAPALKHDVLALCLDYAAKEAVASIPADRLAAFIRRSSALAESKQHTFVRLKVADGALALSFAEGAATADEYYLATDLDGAPALPEIRLDAARVARVLSQADNIALDHIERGVIVFFSKSPNFSYLICGAQEKVA